MTLITKISLGFFTILPIVFALLSLWVQFYHDGYYIDAEISFGQGLKNMNGSFSFNSSGPLPEGYELKVKGDEMILWGPPPEGTTLDMHFVPYYEYVARPTKVNSDYLLDPFFNTKLFMIYLQNNLAYFGIGIVIVEYIFDRLSRKFHQPTVIQIYKIDVITIKIIKFIKRE